MRQWKVFGCVLGSLVGWTALAHSLGGGPVSFATVARGSVSRVKQPQITLRSVCPESTQTDPSSANHAKENPSGSR